MKPDRPAAPLAGMESKRTGLTASALLETPSPVLVLLAFAAVYLIWGSTYLAIRFAIETMPPLMMSGTRHLVAGSILMLGLRCFTPDRFRKGSLREWRDAASAGVLLLVCGNGGVAWAEQYVPSGIAALMVAVVPLWMILFEWLRPGGKRPGLRTAVGLVLGFGGVWIIVQPSGNSGLSASVVGGYAALALASCLWAAGSIYSRHAKTSGPPFLTISRQMISGGSGLLLLGLSIGEGRGLDLSAISLHSWLALLYLTVLGSLIGFSSYVWLMKVSTPSKVSTYAYVNPAIAVFLGWALGGETLSVSLLLGASIVLVSIILVLQKNEGRKEPAAEGGKPSGS